MKFAHVSQQLILEMGTFAGEKLFTGMNCRKSKVLVVTFQLGLTIFADRHGDQVYVVDLDVGPWGNPRGPLWCGLMGWLTEDIYDKDIMLLYEEPLNA